MPTVKAAREAAEKTAFEDLMQRILQTPNFKPTPWMRPTAFRDTLIAATIEHKIPVGRPMAMLRRHLLNSA